MAEKQALSKGEMLIVRKLWDIGPATVREIHESLPESQQMDFSTVQTYLRRIESKGHASSRLEGRIRVYSARTKPQTVIRTTVNDMVERLFGGESMSLVKHLIEDRGIDEDGLSELRAMIDRLEQENK
ncbi:MAG: BlaI/MecI/CopY family transcriptional regulator [Pirellulaceae bacterium]